jgi:hypothetical protein
MDMKKTAIVIGSMFLALGVNTASAKCMGSVVNGNCLGTEIYGSDDSGYSGYSGTKYQYDMGSPSDRNRYSTDLDAQRRDSMSLSTGRMLDRGMGQYGGGIYD